MSGTVKIQLIADGKSPFTKPKPKYKAYIDAFTAMHHDEYIALDGKDQKNIVRVIRKEIENRSFRLITKRDHENNITYIKKGEL